jgi:pimeloyl-ACP methyl ester carboxylesterase
MPDKTLKILRNDNKKSAILFIHGFLGDPNKTWGSLPEFLQKDMKFDNYDFYSFGYSTSLYPDLRGIWTSDASLEILSKLLLSELDIFPLKKYNEISIIAHSMGGLIIQHAIITNNIIREKAKNIIMFGTPSNGLKKSRPFGWFKKQVGDMREDSKFIKSLRSEWDKEFKEKADFNLWVCAGDRDEFVPSSSSLGPFNDSQTYVVNGNHLEMVKPQDIKSMTVRFIKDKILGNVPNDSPLNEGAVLSELGKFEKAISKFKGRESGLDEASLVSYALALEAMGNTDKAIEILLKYNNNKTDALGVLGGRFKRMWINEGIKEYAENAYKMYSMAYKLSKGENNKEQMYYHLINKSFLECLYYNESAAFKKSASEALKICNKLKPGKWESATIGEAYLYLEPQKSLESYCEALKYQPSPREITSMYRQAEIICEKLNLADISDKLYSLFTGVK